jgi:hypothetical protein
MHATCVKARVKRISKMSFITYSYQYFLTLNSTIRLVGLESVVKFTVSWFAQAVLNALKPFK